MSDNSNPEPVQKSETALREEKILEFWKEHNIFQKTSEKESPKGEFVFYEGPPTANAAPALHHIEARVFKDIIPRYKTMRGYHVRRKAGWDTHGLPVELQVEKKLGLKSKKEIEIYGIAKFNKECRENVWSQIDAWTKFTHRIGYWVESTHPYVTYENNYIESLWNIVSRVNERKLLYKDYKVVPWCPRCGTALSSHELAQGYDEITDLSVYVKFKVVGQDNTYILAWTTTPWTLPGNVGLAVGEDIDYVKIKIGSDFLILAKERLSVFTDTSYEIAEEMKGKDLVGVVYESLYPFMEDLATGDAKDLMKNAFKVYPADFVTTTDGTGVVHTAVMYGQEDFELGTKVGLPKFHLVAPDGTFIPGTGFLEGSYVRNEDTTVSIIKDLAGRGLLFKKEKHKHSYPHCWRCKTALIYYARDSWYIRMSELRGDLLAENEKINWEPSHIREGRFGEWLREVKDWAISRERYWGTPLPVWESESGERVIIGSIAELKKRIGKRNDYFLMRHGESVFNVDMDRISSKDKTNNPLTEQGRQEVSDAVSTIKEKSVDIIFSSPFLRTKQTAEIVAEKLGLDPKNIIYDERLDEIQAGDFDGKPWHEFVSKFDSVTDRFERSIDGSESWGDVRKRVAEFLYDVDAQYSGKRILIVGHGGPLNMMSLSSQGLSQREIISHYYDNAVLNAEIIPCDFVALPHDDTFEIDLHRPYIDDVVCMSDSGKPMKRTKEVMDVWFDSGAMPFAQDHYPFENEAWVDGKGYPADFIAEAIDQTRGWFYTLLAVGVLMGKGTSYKNVVCLGHILDAEGKKMSKSIGNVVNPWEMMDLYGVDSLRLWMYSVNQPGDSKNFDPKTVDELVKKVFNPLSNIYSLYAMYETGVSRIDPYSSKNPLDAWMLSRMNQLVSEGTQHLDNFKMFEPVRLLRDFIQDFSTWYVRRSRDRFKSDSPSEVISVTEHILITLSKFMAPAAPFYADWLYLEVSKGKIKESVHLESWPEAKGVDETTLKDMQEVREVVSVALELRQKSGYKVRQPLASLTIPHEFSQDLIDIISDEINVKEVKMVSGSEIILDTNLTPELREEGIVRDIIRGIQDARKKENLNPGDQISLVVFADEKYKALIEKYTNMIQTPTSVTSITYGADAQSYVVSVEEGSVSFSLKK